MTTPPARHERLEAALAERPDDVERASVYADWLIAQDEPHGGVIASAVAVERAGRRRRTWLTGLRKAMSERFSETTVNLVSNQSFASWRLGFLREVGPPVHVPTDWQLLDSTFAVCLEALTIRLDEGTPVTEVGSRLPALRALRRLKVLLPAEVGDVDLAPLARHPRLEWLILERIGLDRPRSLTGLGGLPLERLDLRMGQVDLGGLAAASGLRTLVVVPQGGAVDLGPCRGLPLVRLAVDAPWLRDAEPLLASLPQLQEVAHPSESPLRRDISDRLAARGIEIVDVQPYLPTARQRVG